MVNEIVIEKGVDFSQIDPDIEKQKKGSTSHTQPVASYAGAGERIDKLEGLKIE